MSRIITISKNQGNTHYGVSVEDKYGKSHHLGYSRVLSESFQKEIERKADKIWKNEVEPKKNLLELAIKQMNQSELERSFFSGNRDGLD
tara:strand:- start:65 stop:331 length:267 start_codon:yes stop_codon:yes gene_type:complete